MQPLVYDAGAMNAGRISSPFYILWSFLRPGYYLRMVVAGLCFCPLLKSSGGLH